MGNIKKTEKLWCVLNTLYFVVCLAYGVYMLFEGYRALDTLSQQGNVGAAFGAIAVAVVIALGYIASAVSAVLLTVSAVFWILSEKRESAVLKGAGALAFGIVKIVLIVLFVVSLINGSMSMLIAIAVTAASAVLDFLCFGIMMKSGKEIARNGIEEKKSEK